MRHSGKHLAVVVAVAHWQTFSVVHNEARGGVSVLIVLALVGHDVALGAAHKVAGAQARARVVRELIQRAHAVNVVVVLTPELSRDDTFGHGLVGTGHAISRFRAQRWLRVSLEIVGA